VDAHHIVFDGTSIKPFVEDVLDLYAGTRPSPLRCQYLDAGRRLEERIALTRAADERYWMGVLDPPPPPLRMPLDRPRPALRRARGATTWRRLGQCGLARVRERARAEGVRLLPFLLTHYVAALAGISGQTDVVIGVPVDGRVHRDFAPLIGMFVNTVCIRAMRHRTYPFDRLVGRLRPARDFGRNPLFDAMLVLQNMDVYAFRRTGIAASVEFVLPDVSQADLSLKVFPRPEELAVALQYDSDLFAAASASFLLDRFMELLVRACDGEDYSILPATPSTTMSLDEFVI
jgi:Condensation domain